MSRLIFVSEDISRIKSEVGSDLEDIEEEEEETDTSRRKNGGKHSDTAASTGELNDMCRSRKFCQWGCNS